MREKICGFDDDYIFGIVGGFRVTTDLEPWPKTLGNRLKRY